MRVLISEANGQRGWVRAILIATDESAAPLCRTAAFCVATLQNDRFEIKVMRGPDRVLVEMDRGPRGI